MTKSFLEFFESIQNRQDGAGTSNEAPASVPGPSNAALAAAIAAPTSRPAPSRPHVSASNIVSTVSDAAAGPGKRPSCVADTPANDQLPDDIPWAEVRQAAHRVGPLLTSLRSEQDHQPFSRRETYSLEHVQRLEMFRPTAEYRRPRANKLCSKTHPQPCSYGCKTCHFCRQRTTEIKTVCSMCEGVNNYYGGPARGYWCGSCLWLRVGENIDEVRNKTDWICPACRDLCNCSGANCMRLKRGWFPTQQLAHEARDQGFRSVAHYLVLTHVSAATAAAPIADNSHLARPMVRQRADLAPGDLPPGKRQKTLDFTGHKTREQALEKASQARLQSALAIVMQELGIGSSNNGSNGTSSVLQQLLSTGTESGIGSAGPPVSPFLGILDSDMLDDADDDEAHHMQQRQQRPPGEGAVAASVSASGSALNISAGMFRSMSRPGSSAVDSLDSLPPRQPPRRAEQRTTAQNLEGGAVGAADTSNPEGHPPLGAAQSEDTARLLRLLAPIGEEGGFHDGPVGWGSSGGGGGGSRQRAAGNQTLWQHSGIPGWGAQHTSHRTAHHSRQPGAPAAAAATGAGPSSVRRQHGAHITSDGDDCAMPEGAVTRDSDQNELVDDGANGSALLQESPSRIGMPRPAPGGPQIETAVENGDGAIAIEAEAAREEQQDAQVEQMHAIPQPEQAAAPCTDAHTTLAAEAAKLSEDAFMWNSLCLRASSVVQGVHVLYRHHPEAPNYQGPLLSTPEEDIAAYEAAYDASMEQLKAVLHDAEALTADASTVRAADISPSTETFSDTISLGTLHSHSGLRRAVDLFTYLARLLPEGDVRWRVERRLLGMEPFVEFGGSDVRARAILLTGGYLELLATLHRRGLPTADAASAVADALATTASDMVAALPLLNAILANESLPSEDMRVGAWNYDSAARGRRLIELFSELSELYASLMKLLVFGLQQATALCSVLGISSAAFLTPALVDALLAPGRKLPRDVKREALALVCAVLTAASPRDTANMELDLSANERSARERTRSSLCSVLESKVIPALESLVQRDYPMWGDQQSWRASGSGTGSASGTGDTNEAPAEHVGGEKVEALARCYAFLVSCGKLGWAGVEAKATQPFSFSMFWRQANTAYRHFAVFLLAHTLFHAPSALQAQVHASSAVRLWLQAVTDTGRRHCAWYLTKVLAALPSTAALFVGVEEAALDIRSDVSGEGRAALIAVFGRNLMFNSAWRPQLAAVVGELDVLLASRRKEIEATAFNPSAAVMQWEGAAGKIVLALLGSVSTAMAPAASRNLPRDMAAAPLRKLLTRVAGWAQSSCVEVHLALRRGAETRVEGFDITGTDVEEDLGEQLRTVGDARLRIKSTPFAALPQLLDILRAIGAPAAFDSDPELLEPLWIVFGGCLELGSGEIAPTPVDIAMFEMLGAALAPSSPAEPYAGQEEPLALHRIPLPQQHHELCVYILATLVRRALVRSSLRHVMHERAAVNALRLVAAVLEQPSMRSNAALHAALAPLLWPFLAVVFPDGGAQASVGAKAALYQVLSEVVTRNPVVLPPLSPSPCAGGDRMITALHAFWLAICRDALRCVSSRLQPDTATQKLDLAASRTQNVDPTPLWPITEQTVAEARNVILSTLGRPRDMSALERLSSRPGSLPSLPAVLTSAATSLFRPGDFPWKLAEAAIGLLRTVAIVRAPVAAGSPAPATPEESQPCPGALWTMACFPALHFMIVGAAQATKMLHLAYKSLRRALESALGEESMAAYGLAKPAQPAVALPAPAEAQEQRQPNVVQPQTSGVSIAIPCTNISALSGMSPSSKVTITALLTAARSKAHVSGEVLICTLKDFSGPGGAAAGASLLVSGVPTVMQILKSADLSHGPRVVRVVDATLARVAAKPGELCVLKILANSSVVMDPDGPAADALRVAQRVPKTEAGNTGVHSGLEMQATQPVTEVVVKTEQLSATAQQASGGVEDTQLLRNVCNKLLEMGYSEQQALGSIRDLKREAGSGTNWLAGRSKEQLVDEAVRRLG